MKPIRIMIVDDQALMRDGLRTILDLEADLEVAAVAGDGEEALRVFQEAVVDVVLLDIRMPKMDGVECAGLLKKRDPRVKIIMLTTFNEETYIFDALRNGASGYLLKDMEGDQLIRAVREAYAGRMMMPADVAAKIAGSIGAEGGRDVSPKVLEALSGREMDIARLMAGGLTNGQIAESLFLSMGTVKNHISSIYGKIGINDRAKAVLYLSRRL